MQENARSWIEAGAVSVWVVDPVAGAVSVFGRSAIRSLGPGDAPTDPELFPG
ncbi:MAG: hypothetical protein NXI31_14555 [bacterium]|nr:hypothetical protein [bacterium]